MKDTTVCFTGHREISADKRKDVLKALAKTVGELYLQGYRTFCAGGALGFDTLAAAVVLVLKKKKDAACASIPFSYRDDRLFSPITPLKHPAFQSAAHSPTGCDRRHAILMFASDPFIIPPFPH